MWSKTKEIRCDSPVRVGCIASETTVVVCPAVHWCSSALQGKLLWISMDELDLCRFLTAYFQKYECIFLAAYFQNDGFRSTQSEYACIFLADFFHKAGSRTMQSEYEWIFLIAYFQNHGPAKTMVLEVSKPLTMKSAGIRVRVLLLDQLMSGAGSDWRRFRLETDPRHLLPTQMLLHIFASRPHLRCTGYELQSEKT